jgi:hypothetical protein
MTNDKSRERQNIPYKDDPLNNQPSSSSCASCLLYNSSHHPRDNERHQVRRSWRGHGVWCIHPSMHHAYLMNDLRDICKVCDLPMSGKEILDMEGDLHHAPRSGVSAVCGCRPPFVYRQIKGESSEHANQYLSCCSATHKPYIDLISEGVATRGSRPQCHRCHRRLHRAMLPPIRWHILKASSLSAQGKP